MALRHQPLSQALSARRPSVAPALLLTVGMLIALGAAGFGYLESRRTERVVIALRPVPYGHQISAEDLGVVELPLHRPAQLEGLAHPADAVGRWAAREIGPNDLLQPSMLLVSAPDQPVYPNGRRLSRNAVPLPFSVSAVGPLTDRDHINIGFTSTDPALCAGLAGAGEPGHAYTCRLLAGVPVLYVDGATAYLEVTPYQAQAVSALLAAGAQLWGERYGASSDALPSMDRLDARQIDPSLLQPAPTAAAGR